MGIIATYAIHAQNVTFVWAKQMGGTLSNVGSSIAIDGSVYTAGYFAGTVDFDPGAPVFNLTSAGGNDIFVSKLDASGNFVWAVRFGNSGADIGQSVVLDGTGNVYITGYFEGTTDFDPGAGTFNLISAGLRDIFILKLDAAGNFVWAKNMGGTTDDESYSIALDATGNTYTTGYFTGTADFDPGLATSNLISAGLFDIFVSKLDPSGNFVWARQMGGTTDDFGLSIRIDGGNVISTGAFSGTADLDPVGTANFTSVSGNDTYISKLDAAGNFVWAKQFGGTGADQGNSVTIDGLGNIYTTGYFDGTTDFDPGVGTSNFASAGLRDIFISKLDASGNFVWAKQIGGTGSDQGRSIILDGSANVYTTGSFAGTVDFDPGASILDLISAGDRDIFVSKLDVSGNFVVAKSIGGTLFEQGESLVIDAQGIIHITGFFNGTVDFDPGPGTANLTSQGGNDIFVLKLNQAVVTPVTLIDFTAKLANQAVLLQWRSASEQNTARFEIEKSINGTSFASIGTVQAAGNSSSTKNYSFNDQQSLSGNNYYRLKMIDADGTFTYSKVVVVRVDGKTTLQVFPNPAKNIIYVQATGNDKNTLVRITDGAGKIVKEQKLVLNGTTSFSIDISSLPKGLYYLTLKDASKIQQQKIIKQ